MLCTSWWWRSSNIFSQMLRSSHINWITLCFLSSASTSLVFSLTEARTLAFTTVMLIFCWAMYQVTFYSSSPLLLFANMLTQGYISGDSFWYINFRCWAVLLWRQQYCTSLQYVCPHFTFLAFTVCWPIWIAQILHKTVQSPRIGIFSCFKQGIKVVASIHLSVFPCT